MKVLIIEDEKALVRQHFTYLNSEQYVCEIAAELSIRDDENRRI